MIVVDTTILVYAHGRDHPLMDLCREIIGVVVTGQLRDVRTSVEVVQEFAHHRGRTRDRADAVRLARYVAEAFAPLISFTAQDLDDGLRLFEEVRDLGAFDSVLAAAARNRGAAGLVSADRGFGSVPGLVHVNPADADALERLQSM